MINFFRKLWPLAAPYRSRLFLGLVFGLLNAAVTAFFVLVLNLVVNVLFGTVNGNPLADQLAKAPKLLRPLTDLLMSWLPTVQRPSSTPVLILLVCSIPALVCIRNLCGYLNVYLMNWVAARCIADLRTRLFSHLQSLPLSFFSDARTGDLISRITNDTLSLYSIFSNALPSLIRDPATILFLLAVLLTQHAKLTLISMIAFPICVIPVAIYARKARQSGRAMQKHISELTSLMHESFTGNRVIKAYNLEPKAIAEFKEMTAKYVSHLMRLVRASEIPSQLTEILGAVGVALVIIYAVLWPNPTESTPGAFISYIMSIVLLYPSLKSLTRLHNQLNQAEAASSRIFELLDTPLTLTDPPSPVAINAHKADIQFEQIDFAYGEKPVLRNFNLTVKAGTMVALVGASGSGKTTVANLLLRFYDPQRGAVRIGGTDIRQAAIKDLRSQIALVTQETIIFNDSIRHNIALGRPGASDEDIQKSAKHAFAHEFILQKEGGYEAPAGERGGNLSMGQRQRLTIARAIVRDAPILILDEATSSLDTETERALQAALDELMEGRTTICIAHRLSTIQNADMIVVLDQGRIVETGTHAELLQCRGAYYKLYES